MELLADGAIADVLVAKAWNNQKRRDIGHGKLGTPPANLDYDLWLGPAPEVPYYPNRLHYNWHWRHAYGHGFDVCWTHLEDVEIVGLADPHKGGRTLAMKRTGAAKDFADYKEMMDETKPEIDSICTRHPDQHRDMFLAAAERGIHAYMEKPMCRTPAEADEMVAAAEKHKVKLAFGDITRYSPILDIVSGLILDGAIGQVLEIRSLGKEDGEPITKKHVKPGREALGPLAGDTVHAVFGLDGSRIATFDSVRGTGTGRPWRFGLQIMGSKGIIEIQTGYLPPAAILQDSSWCPALSGKKWQTITSAGVGKPEPFQGDYRLEGNIVACKDLIQAIRDDRRPECDVHQGRIVIEMLNAVFEFQRVEGPVTFPLKTRENAP